MKSLKIFNVELFNEDVSFFCKLSRKEKTDWIKENTNQKNATLIKEFLDTYETLKKDNCGCGCK